MFLMFKKLMKSVVVVGKEMEKIGDVILFVLVLMKKGKVGGKKEFFCVIYVGYVLYGFYEV